MTISYYSEDQDTARLGKRVSLAHTFKKYYLKSHTLFLEFPQWKGVAPSVHAQSFG